MCVRAHTHLFNMRTPISPTCVHPSFQHAYIVRISATCVHCTHLRNMRKLHSSPQHAYTALISVTCVHCTHRRLPLKRGSIYKQPLETGQFNRHSYSMTIANLYIYWTFIYSKSIMHLYRCLWHILNKTNHIEQKKMIMQFSHSYVHIIPPE